MNTYAIHEFVSPRPNHHEIDPHVLEQIIDKSKQPEILMNCPEDTARRFTDESAFREWSGEVGTAVLSFMAQDADLAGLIFFRDKSHHLSRASTTFAIRIYEGYSGRGLAKTFMNDSHQWLTEVKNDTRYETSPWLQQSQGIWLSVKPDNQPAIAAYRSFGYRECGRELLKNRIIMEYDGRNE